MAAALAVFLVVLPYELLSRLNGVGLSTALSVNVIVIAGLGVCALVAARHIAKPTRAYGPVCIGSSAFSLAYLLFISQRGSAMFSTHNTTVTLTYGTVFLLLAVVPALNVVSGIFTTIEDIWHPGERLPFDFPA